ncbi:9862_t:CDS:2 [Ambispora gerdemannii]|uniref:9862_t:CDS:1 n=1 Tax=Ambispora gerdemannii TaxID=144530 RepID=A0A9N8W6X7_9GLOM|nr:9862_t:CDS:2 [Ambispora gerdemannii]
MSTETSTQTAAAPSNTETTQQKSRPSARTRQDTIIADQILTTDQDAQSHSQLSRVIVIAIDHSSHSQHAFDWAFKNLLRKETDLKLKISFSKLYSAIGATYIDFSEMISSVEEQQRAISHQLLQEFALKLKNQNFACKAIAMRGDARDEIVRKVDEVNADALVIGSRGLGALRRTILGSVSDYCSHACHCTVIIVKEREHHE